MIPLGGKKYLGFLLEPPECLTVENPITIMLKSSSDRARLLIVQTTVALATETGKRGQGFPFPAFEKRANVHPSESCPSREVTFSFYTPAEMTMQTNYRHLFTANTTLPVASRSVNIRN
jgi:hypothetical protein